MLSHIFMCTFFYLYCKIDTRNIMFIVVITAFSALRLLVGHAEEHPGGFRPIKFSDEVLVLLSVWSKVQMICI